MKAVVLGLLVFVALLPASLARSSEPQENWMVGAWHMTQDEDGTAADIMEFRADGTHIFWGVPGACVPFTTNYHVRSGDVYVTAGVPSKGPIALIFRPSDDRTKLVFTSPRTRNNATYERLQKSPCSAG